MDFGHGWAEKSVVAYFKELIIRHKVLLTPRIAQNSLEELRQGRIPRLAALNLLNGTVYPWNRPCYGITQGKPHIRIESRYLPAGPTILDEVANAAATWRISVSNRSTSSAGGGLPTAIAAAHSSSSQRWGRRARATPAAGHGIVAISDVSP